MLLEGNKIKGLIEVTFAETILYNVYVDFSLYMHKMIFDFMS
jgi:hypothetical protein